MNAHLIREKAEDVEKVMASCVSQVADAIIALEKAKGISMDKDIERILEYLREAWGVMNLSNYKIYEILCAKPIPELPPLDLSTVPAPIVYK